MLVLRNKQGRLVDADSKMERIDVDEEMQRNGTDPSGPMSSHIKQSMCTFDNHLVVRDKFSYA